MKPWIAFAALAVSTTFGVLLVRQHLQERAAQARDDEVMRPFNELRAKHERELAVFKAQEQARLKREEERIGAIVDYWDVRLRAAQKLYDQDAAIYGKEEATRRHQAGVYMKAVLGGELPRNTFLYQTAPSSRRGTQPSALAIRCTVSRVGECLFRRRRLIVGCLTPDFAASSR